MLSVRDTLLAAITFAVLAVFWTTYPGTYDDFGLGFALVSLVLVVLAVIAETILMFRSSSE